MTIMIVLYLKRNFFAVQEFFLIILCVFSFSLIIGMISIRDGSIPFSPYIQMFFLLFQSILFTIGSLEVYNDKKK